VKVLKIRKVNSSFVHSGYGALRCSAVWRRAAPAPQRMQLNEYGNACSVNEPSDAKIYTSLLKEKINDCRFVSFVLDLL